MTSNRRHFLTRALGSLAVCACCPPSVYAATAAKAPAAGHGPHWAYDGKAGPGNWSKVSPDFKTCSIGVQQTPIDLNGAIEAKLKDPLRFDYKPFAMKILNNGHTIQVNAGAGSGIFIGTERYELVQFHFHHPSEHLLAGKAFDMECHFVHKSAAGALAVVGVFITPGKASAGLEPILAAMPGTEGPEVATGVTIDPSLLLARGAYFRYMGSLTTPPCSEGLTWSVFHDPIEASTDQIMRFAKLFPLNARPVQPLNRRFILELGS